MLRWNFLCFNLYTVPLMPLSTTEKSLAPSSLHPPSRHLHTLIRYPWAFSSLGWTLITFLSLSSYERYSSPLIIFVILRWTCSTTSMPLLYWGAQHSTPGVSHQGWVEGKDRFPRPAGNALPNTAQESVGRLCDKGTLMTHVQLPVCQNLRSFSAKLPSSQSAPSVYWSVGLVLCKCRTWHFPFFQHCDFLVNPFFHPE